MGYQDGPTGSFESYQDMIKNFSKKNCTSPKLVIILLIFQNKDKYDSECTDSIESFPQSKIF